MCERGFKSYLEIGFVLLGDVISTFKIPYNTHFGGYLHLTQHYWYRLSIVKHGGSLKVVAQGLACLYLIQNARIRLLIYLSWLNTVFTCAVANAIPCVQKDHKNKHAVDTAIILFALCPLYLCFLFFVFEHSVLMVLVLLQRYVRKCNDAKNPAILGFFFV